MREKVKPELYDLDEGADALAPFRLAAETAIRNLGLTADPPALSPEHWQRVLAAVETRMRLSGIEAPDGWREDLAFQMGRAGDDAHAGPES